MDVLSHGLAEAASLLFIRAVDVGACGQSYIGTIWIPCSSTRDYDFVYTIGFRNLARQDRLGRLAVGGCRLFRLHTVFLPLIELPSYDR